MSKQRLHRTQRLQAAREWLASAENSLMNKNDIEGDLKLMLAQAELASLSEASHARRIKLFSAIALTLILALAGYIIYQPPTDKQPVSIIAKNNINQATASAKANEQQLNTGLNTDKSVTMNVAGIATDKKSLETEKNFTSQEVAERIIIKSVEQTDQNFSEQVEVKTITAEPIIPTGDMQKLMQLAGKALRE